MLISIWSTIQPLMNFLRNKTKKYCSIRKIDRTVFLPHFCYWCIIVVHTGGICCYTFIYAHKGTSFKIGNNLTNRGWSFLISNRHTLFSNQKCVKNSFSDL